ncbi:hypothetical protein [Anaeromyxobacter sp. Fw109-5]|nr:hypothetical protein [Anaeromyxobacter sp. Fw109-5]
MHGRRAGAQLEWFDSEDGDRSVRVTDARGRRLIVKIKALQVKVLEVADT